MFAYMAAPPNNAPKPRAAVTAGAGLLKPVAVAVATVPVPVAVAEPRRLLTFALRELVRPLSSEDRLLAMPPVAVARTEDSEDARAPASLVSEATLADTLDRWLVRAEPSGSSQVGDGSAALTPVRMPPPASVALARTEDQSACHSAPMEAKRSSVALALILSPVVSSSAFWAWGSD